MITRRKLVLHLASGLLLLPLLSTAQAQNKVIKRIGVLSGGARPASVETSRAGSFLQGMRELGYVEGRDFVVEWRFAEGKYDRLADFAAEFVQMRVDVIVVFNTRAAIEAQRVTKTIPIVFAAIRSAGEWTGLKPGASGREYDGGVGGTR